MSAVPDYSNMVVGSREWRQCHAKQGDEAITGAYQLMNDFEADNPAAMAIVDRFIALAQVHYIAAGRPL